ncbi:NAD-dependent epimerase/dehydratase family protein [Gillisia sp. M10.2A]|uniref:NAD-dependent epimerase/dehydratase family protein n=1 Tax=Gillisia lutea TaxID=2909668 RepID=A0ABS9EGK0_9FLAO|nr:NAD-dependent epimerase/dehydratase family protein [Gillisia lutea]MCF4100548.1 NAD-dependent epimerase/dehydratase family protein [Gillisia lutea]
MKSAIILGATGLTGRALLNRLLDDPKYNKIILFSRSSVNIQNEKIEEHLIDVLQLQQYKDFFRADEVFCCIGTTKSQTPNKDLYHKIDYGIPVSAAKLCRENKIETFLVISALGANANSKVFYNKVKGEMQHAVLEQGISRTYIFQPSLIAGDRAEKRFFENLAKQSMKIVNYLLIGSLKKYRSIPPETIAQAMHICANSGYSKILIESDEIQQIASA